MMTTDWTWIFHSIFQFTSWCTLIVTHLNPGKISQTRPWTWPTSTVSTSMWSVCSKHSCTWAQNAANGVIALYGLLWETCIIPISSIVFWNKICNLSTAPGCTRKPSVTLTWSKAEHRALSWGCSWIILYSGEDKVLMWLPQQFGLLLNTVLWIPTAGGWVKCCELSVLLLALLNGTLRASLSVKVPCSINRKKTGFNCNRLLQPLPHFQNESIKQKCWLSSFLSCFLYYIGLCMQKFYCL